MRNKQNIIGIGELLWDVLPEGKKLGGAPCNFVYHAQKQGAKALALSAIGNDDNGKEILEVLKAKNISSELIQINDKSTGTVDIALNNEGVPSYIIHENVAWDFILFNNVIEQKVSKADIICFGSLAQRSSTSHETIEKILKCCKSEALKVYDINLRQDYYSHNIIEKSLQLCNVLKLNEDELPVVCELLGVHAETEELQILDLIKKYNLKLAAYTKGSESSFLMTSSDKSYMPTPKVEVKDTVGAGDSFTAAMIVGFAKGNSLKDIHQKAVEISAFVCTQDGAMPEYY
jgi:fructokinase